MFRSVLFLGLLLADPAMFVCQSRFRKAQGSVQRLHNTGGSLPRTRIAELLACSLVSRLEYAF